MSESADDGPGRREVAYRLFATEYDDADLQYSESDEERAPNYVVTPTGARVNRLFVAGVLTEVEAVSEEVLRGRVVDPTGAFVCYAGQYQPDERAALQRLDPPAFVAVTGKGRTFQPEDSDRVFTSVRPESISTVDATTRDRWTVTAAERTIDRVKAMATAIALGATGDQLREALLGRGFDEGLAAGIPVALEHYGTTPTYLAAVRDLAIDAARHVTGDLDEVPELSVDPAVDGDVTAADLLPEAVDRLTSEASGEETVPEPADVATPEVSEPGTDTGSANADAGNTPEQPAETEESPNTPPEETSEPDGTADPAVAEAPADPAEFDLDADEREAVEAEYGTEFRSASEVDEPGEADIETPTPKDAAAEGSDSTGSAPESEGSDIATDDAPAEPPDADTEIEPADLVDAAVDAMEDLDEGDGADRTEVVDVVAKRTGADTATVDDAIQNALMDGRCYEPDDGTLKPI